MSLVEIELYFVQFARWLVRQEQEITVPASLRLVGASDSERLPVLDASVQRFAALVHLDRTALVPVGSDLKRTGQSPLVN